MSNPFDDFGFHARDGARWGIRWILVPFIVVMMATAAIAGGFYMTKAKDIPTGPPDLTNPEVVGQAATTDLYGNSLLSAFNCVRDYPESSCDQEEKKSKLIISATEEILIVNGEQLPIPDKKSLVKVLTTDPNLKKLEFTNFTTTQKKTKDTTILYTNTSEKGEEQKITMHFEKNDTGEMVLKSMEVVT